MNRNSEQHYSQVPHAKIQRAKFKRDYSLLTTINEGQLIPLYVDEVLPGDTFKINLRSVIRMSTPIYPVMDNCYIDYFWFFVPARLCWEHFVNLMGQNDSTFWAPTVEYTTPKTTSPTGGWNVGTIADYMGIPTGIEGLEVNSMPFRAYALIWNEWFRDENLQQPKTVSKGDETTEGSNTGTNLSDAEAGGLPLTVAKYHDYFTSCLPSPQKSTEPVSLVVANNAVWPLQNFNSADLSTAINQSTVTTSDGSSLWNATTQGDVTGQVHIANSTNSSSSGWLGTAVNMSASFTINELRQAIALQQIFEQDARNGTRYTEQLRGAWGVTSPDSRLQRPEYIGGYRQPINMNQVIQQSSTDATSPQGNTAAYSLTTGHRKITTYSAVEHGYVLGLAAVRVEHSYQQGLRRMWTRSDRFSYYHPLLANLGEQAVLNREIYAQGTAEDEEVFGYQEAWADYRYMTNQVTSEMRSTYAQSLDAWHYGDYYESLPTLSDSWIQEGTELIDRTIAVQSETSHQFICSYYFDQTWTRPMPIYSIPGLSRI